MKTGRSLMPIIIHHTDFVWENAMIEHITSLKRLRQLLRQSDTKVIVSALITNDDTIRLQASKKQFLKMLDGWQEKDLNKYNSNISFSGKYIHI